MSEPFTERIDDLNPIHRVPDTIRKPDEPTDSDTSEINFLQPSTNPNSLGVLGHYEVKEILGRGGFGIVFKAVDDVLHRLVAIKVLAPAVAMTPMARQRFLREARAAAAVRHENVVQVYAIEEKPLPYIVMEYIPGETLQKRIETKGHLSVDETIRIAHQIAIGLAAAHDSGLIHRDIKPANVLLEQGADLRVKLTDFGLARPANDTSLSQSGVIAGTPLYMAPEQAYGETLDQRTDLFSLGSVMYVMLAGLPPFQAATPMAVLHSVCSDTPKPLRELNSEIPVWLSDVITRLHQKDPAKRFHSARALADILLQHIDATVVSMEQITPPTRQATYYGRMLLFAGVLFFGIVSAFAIYLANQVKDLQPDAGQQNSRTVPPMTKKTSPVLPLAELLASSDYEWAPAENLGDGVNTNERELAPTLTADELTMVFMRGDKYYITERDSVDRPFPAATPLSNEINQKVRESPTITSDGLILVFPSLRSRPGSIQLWMSRRNTRQEPFGIPVELPEPVRDVGWNVSPLISGNGLTLYATSSRSLPPASGDVIRFTRKSRDDAFANPEVLPAPINSPLFDTPDWISPDELVLVLSKKGEKISQCRFYARSSPNEPFGEGKSFGTYIESINITRPWISPDGQRMYFHQRNMPDGRGELDLWVTRRVLK